MRDDESRVMTFACGRHGPLHALVRFMVPSLRSLIPLAGRRSVVDHSKVRCFTIVRTFYLSMVSFCPSDEIWGMTLIQLDPICYELWISANKSSEPGLSILLLYYRGALAPHRPLLLLSCLGSGKNLARTQGATRHLT